MTGMGAQWLTPVFWAGCGQRQSTICELLFPTSILGVKLNRKRMIVVLEEHKTLTSKRMQPFEEQEAARRAV